MNEALANQSNPDVLHRLRTAALQTSLAVLATMTLANCASGHHDANKNNHPGTTTTTEGDTVTSALDGYKPTDLSPGDPRTPQDRQDGSAPSINNQPGNAAGGNQAPQANGGATNGNRTQQPNSGSSNNGPSGNGQLGNIPTPSTITSAPRTGNTTATTSQPSNSTTTVAQTPSQLYVSPYNQAAGWLRDHPDVHDSGLSYLATQPTGIWLNGTGNDTIAELDYVIKDSRSQNKFPILVINGLQESCTGANAEDTARHTQYLDWIHKVTTSIGRATVVTIIEPNQVASTTDAKCSPAEKNGRLNTIKQAVSTLSNGSGTTIYIADGNAGWNSPEITAGLLQQAGIDQAEGMIDNISDYYSDAQSIAFTDKVDKALGKKYLAYRDTSRNGNPSYDGNYCNPPNRKVGVPSSIDNLTFYVNIAGAGDCQNAGTWSASTASAEAAR